MSVKTKFLLQVAFLLFSFSCFSQEIISAKNFAYSIQLDSIYSKELKNYKVIHINLPKDYNSHEKYPVIYTLDAKWMFEPIVSEVRTLSDFDVIPKAIVIGIYQHDRNDDLDLDWKSGNFNTKSALFYEFIKNDLIPEINNTYATSGFNVLVGHSNAATFCHKVLIQENQPFNGFIALSQNLFGDQQKEFESLLKKTSEKELFYFVASGKRDATPRLEVGYSLDSIFQKNINTKYITQHNLYNANHDGVVAKGLNDGIAHVFSKYFHYNDWDEKLLDSLVKSNSNPLDFLSQHSKQMEDAYGIDFKVNDGDLSLMRFLARTENDMKAVQELDIKTLGKGDHFYATYAQYYEYAKLYEKALEFWNINLKKGYEHNANFFYYRRPISLIYKKMNRPRRAIEYIKSLKQNYPNKVFYLNYYMAKIASESMIYKEEYLKAITQCIDNYKDNNTFRLDKAIEIKKRLEKQRG